MEKEGDKSLALNNDLMDRIKYIDGKILGKNCKPLKAATSGVPLRKPGEVPGDKGEASSENLFDASSAEHATEDEHEHASWDDPKFHAMKNTFVSVVAFEPPKKKLNFRTLTNDEKVAESDFVLPLATIAEVKHKFSNSLVGYFVGKSVAFTLVENYVTNTWAKFGFQKGPWLIRNTSLILNKWTPNLALKKDEVTKVPVWVKMHTVPVVAYSEDGLSLIAMPLRVLCVKTHGDVLGMLVL
ncbi:retrovirus-related pol polyprotein from transposon TNT 1-94 [Tanacetum coccineum]